MQLSESQKQIIGYVLALTILVMSSIATSYGIVIPELKAALKPTATIGARATMFNGILCNSGETNCVESYGMNLLVNNAAGAETFKVTASTGAVSISGASFTGPIKYGTSATYTSGTNISHGFTTTPTMCIFSPLPVTATLTITSTGFSANWTNANPVYWMCGK